MLRVGLTGGIGSGKSVVARVFETLGIPVYYADDAARKIQNTDPLVKLQIVSAFGPDAYNDAGLNRKYISGIVFSNKEKLEVLNAIVHPATLKDAEEWLKNQTTPYAIKEAALIFESGAQRDLDFIIGVTAPLPLRIKRTMQRDGITEDEVQKRMDKQIKDIIKMSLCDAVINNDEKQLLIPQVLDLHAKLVEMANSY